jgi:hypothetical protein
MPPASLPIGNLGSSCKMLYPSDFAIIAGKHKYRCSKLIAAFLSPKIAQLISGDILADSYVLPFDDSKFEFKQVFRLLQGDVLEITRENRHYLAQIGELLGNQEIIAQVRDFVPDNVDPLAVLQSAIDKIEMGLRPDQELDYIASHLSEFSDADFRHFRLEDLYTIFFSDNLRVDDESSVFQLVMKIIRNQDHRARVLLYSIAYENLTVAEMVEFADEVTNSELTGSIFHSLCKRLVRCVNRRKYPVRRLSDDQEFTYREGTSFDGFFDAVHRLWNRNAHDEGIVTITTSDGTSAAKVIDRNWKECWVSKNIPNSWVQFDFMDRVFQLTHYTLKTFIGGPDSGHLKHWVVEGSNNLKDWTEIDRRDNCTGLNDRNRYRTYKCEGSKGLYRYIRLKQTGKNHRGNDFMFLGNVEFFGALY